MNKIKTTRGLLSAVIVAAALGLVACGGGASSDSPQSLLGTGAVGTVGDGVNLAEYNAIQCGMTQAQVETIVGDAPTTSVVVNGDGHLNAYKFGNLTVVVTFNGTGVINKSLTQGQTSIQSTKC